MNLTYYKILKTNHLVEEFFHISYSNKIIPFNTILIPFGFSGLSYIYNSGQNIFLDNNETKIKGLILSGQFNKSSKLNVEEAGFSCGISFKPTALHKLTNLNISKFTNKHSLTELLNKDLTRKFEVIFNSHNNDFENLFNDLENLLLSFTLIENKNTIAIDKAIDFIHKKQGMVSVKNLLEIVPFGQKTLETQFKKMIGLTPSKYMRIYRFKKLMEKYENNKIELKDLVYMYNYYDESHFSKDFKAFTSKLPNEYFKEDFSLIKEALKK
ncbi:helix-turn-helix domain-containing protein [Tenacibaculum aquimarinum]|uniref:helix-turn-helix domain-containing protein n=1 Tax=Tenacibaculum aquimarinum TaxID=2910675 RepID=UPI001F0A88C4|nr:helix-turn-helix domain-containing protein [Tenacibaculum aquimarinum]MCH3882339.1 helix-turn-helix domain-containing protein [Tenacibaculum aquimarinum]